LTSLILAIGVLLTHPHLQHRGEDEGPVVDVVVEVDQPPGSSEPGQTRTRHDVRISGRQASNVNASLAAGDRVVVAGHLASYVHVDLASGTRFRRQRVLASVVAISLEEATAIITAAVPHASSAPAEPASTPAPPEA